MPPNLHSKIVGELKGFLKSPDDKDTLKGLETTLDKSLKPKEAQANDFLNNNDILIRMANMEFKSQGLIANELV